MDVCCANIIKFKLTNKASKVFTAYNLLLPLFLISTRKVGQNIYDNFQCQKVERLIFKSCCWHLWCDSVKAEKWFS